MHVFFTAAHAGYPSDRVPLGGGMIVYEAFARAWSNKPPFSYTILGSGPDPLPGISYVRVLQDFDDLVHLSAWKYAQFCRRFEHALTQFILKHKTSDVVVLSNDIIEGPAFDVLAKAGIPLVTIYHTNPVEYFAKFYLNDWFQPQQLVRWYDQVEKRSPFLIPDFFELLFHKQADSIRYSKALVLPSHGLAESLEKCHPNEVLKKAVILPWQIMPESQPPERVEEEKQKIQNRYGIQPEDLVLVTLSRLSPEKGLDLLLEALEKLEYKIPELASKIYLFMCGQPAYMKGLAYYQKLCKQALKLQKVRVYFPGYVSGIQKAAYLDLADLFVSPSKHEVYGLAILEAMHAGLPILAAKHYGAVDLVQSDFGVIVPLDTNTVGNLTNSLVQLLSNPKQLIQMGHFAQESTRQMSFQQTLAELQAILFEKSKT